MKRFKKFLKGSLDSSSDYPPNSTHGAQQSVYAMDHPPYGGNVVGQPHYQQQQQYTNTPPVYPPPPPQQQQPLPPQLPPMPLNPMLPLGMSFPNPEEEYQQSYAFPQAPQDQPHMEPPNIASLSLNSNPTADMSSSSGSINNRNNDMAPISTLDPSKIFPVDQNAYKPNLNLFRVSKALDSNEPKQPEMPIPTNEWWENLMLENGDNPVTTYPYMIKALSNELHLSYPTFNASETFVISVWHNDWIIKPSGNNSQMFSNRSVIGYDDVSVTLQWTGSSSQSVPTPGNANPGYNTNPSMKSTLVKGQLFVTVDVQNWYPRLTTGHAILSVQQLAKELVKVKLNDDREWIIASWPPISWTQTDTSNLESQPQPTSNNPYPNMSGYSGIIRIAHIPKGCKILDSLSFDSLMTYPVGGKIDIGTTSNSQQQEQQQLEGRDRKFSQVELHYDTKGVNGDPSNLLMLALPHQVDTMVYPGPLTTLSSSPDNVDTNNSSECEYRCIKGKLNIIKGNKWIMHEPLTPIDFYGPTKITDPDDTEHLKKLLRTDVNELESCPVPPDPYFGGKWLAKCARLCIIADELKETSLRDQAVARLKSVLVKWLLPLTQCKSKIKDSADSGSGDNNSNPEQIEEPQSDNDALPQISGLVYDSTWGGIVSKNGMTDSFADFGNGRYNDHHFHYGYFLYSSAVLAKLGALSGSESSGIIDATMVLLRDYANASRSDPAFPFLRHFDLFDGHSWASGTFAFADSRNQESTSEAINAHYGAYLFSKAIGRADLEAYYHTLLCMEARVAKKYWQIGPNSVPKTTSPYSSSSKMDDSSIYIEPFGQSHFVVGVLWGTKVDFTTFFGNNPEFIYGIQFLPYTPATHLLLDPVWIKYIWEKELRMVADQAETDGWREIVTLPLAVVDQVEARDRIQRINQHDDGNSATNAFYFIATAKSKKPQ
ncbi:hypothetical protein H4219_000363 [Mycoemilia scoparia]|uniref:glucan endo-1,3-beta-D-glucosidase n=1 Tax=Mycoemilia scoparia TaxID=417184 RepID=A0A9W8DWW0_9FUNG|nr:hypothetical protein H4219_000363 [Mycoemilia scoparia]